MAVISKEDLIGKFENGDLPNGDDFKDLIDSCYTPNLSTLEQTALSAVDEAVSERLGPLEEVSNSNNTTLLYNSGNWNTAYNNVSSQALNKISNVEFSSVQIGNTSQHYFFSPIPGSIGLQLTGSERYRFDSANFELRAYDTCISFGSNNSTGAAKTRQNLGLGTASQTASGDYAPSNLYQNLTANWESVYNNVNALSGEWEHPSIKVYINGDTNLFNMLNSTEYIIPFNGGESYDTEYFGYNSDNRNIIIKKSGRYRIKVRFAAYDMQDASDYLRIRLRSSFIGLITDVNSGTLLTTLSWKFAGGTLGVNGEMFVEGETYLNNTLPSGTDLYIAATVLGAGGSGDGGTTFYPVFDNALGLQPFMEVEKIN